MIVLDVETTTHNKGSPFSKENRLCYVGLLDNTEEVLYDIEYGSKPYTEKLSYIQEKIDQSNPIVGFNIKFDLHWIRKYGLSFSNNRIWDCQLVFFILQHQQTPYPSLNEVASHYGLGCKHDGISSEYWDNGIDTPNIPEEELKAYLSQDLLLTKQIYEKQQEELEQSSTQTKKLISLHNQDLLCLQEMEWNGLLYDTERSVALGSDLDKTIRTIDASLSAYTNLDWFNFNSGDHLSCLLYGGKVTIPYKEIVGTYKTGERKGQEKWGWKERDHVFPQLVQPLKGSELKKQGMYATDEQTLRRLKGEKELISLLLERSFLEKRKSTYYDGIPALIVKQGWEGKIHGQLNQCVARTGRLSSSKPNLQNFDSNIKELFYSRYIGE